MAFHLKKVLKAWLLSSSQPLSLRDIQAAFARFHDQPEDQLFAPEGADEAPARDAAAPAEPEPAPAEEPVLIAESAEDTELYHDVPSLVTAAQVREAMDEIAAELKVNDEGLLLIEGANGYRLVTHPRFGRWVRILRQEPPPVKLSQSSLETLAVVAYRQPVTRGEIESIRGVSAEAGLNKLMERELVAIVGRAELPGRPLQYGTTEKFLEFTGIRSLDELPASDVLSSRQIDEWLRTNVNPATPSDKEMGLETELETASEPATAEPPPGEDPPAGDAAS